MHLLGTTGEDNLGSSLVYMHVVRECTPPPTCAEELAERVHPRISERLLKSTLLVEGVSTRSGLGAISTAHTKADLSETLEGVRASFERLVRAGLV